MAEPALMRHFHAFSPTRKITQTRGRPASNAFHRRNWELLE
jgi:hypothetical protein